MAVLAAALLLCAPACWARHGRGAAPAPNPFALPQLTAAQAQSMFTFLGSFTAPSNFAYGGSGVSITGSTMYMSSIYGGFGAMTIPALSGTPDYIGGNGSAALAITPVTPPANLWTTTCGPTCAITGSYVFNNALYVTNTNGYDVSCTDQKGWVAQVNPGLTSWGAVNTAAGQTSEFNRYLAGQIAQVPAIWQPYFGQAYVTAGEGQSGAECDISQGPSAIFFNPADVTSAGAAVPITVALNYPIANSLAGQQFSGPFPICTQTDSCSPSGSGYPATFSTAPTAGATTADIALPTGTVVAVGNIIEQSFATAYNAIQLTSITSGTISDSGIKYTLSDSAGLLSGEGVVPAYDYSPGTSLSTGEYRLTLPLATGATADTITMTPAGYASADTQDRWTVTFSDGEVRVVSISGSTMSWSAPLACSPSCGTSFTLAPMGDALMTDYDGAPGSAEFVPGTSTFVAVGIHNYGPNFGRVASVCDTAGSASNSYMSPLAPDTVPYKAVTLYLYSASQLYAGAIGAQPSYQAQPYATMNFPDNLNLMKRSCLQVSQYANGWAVFQGDLLYLAIRNGAGANIIVYEYQVTPP